MVVDDTDELVAIMVSNASGLTRSRLMPYTASLKSSGLVNGLDVVVEKLATYFFLGIFLIRLGFTYSPLAGAASSLLLNFGFEMEYFVEESSLVGTKVEDDSFMGSKLKRDVRPNSGMKSFLKPIVGMTGKSADDVVVVVLAVVLAVVVLVSSTVFSVS